MLTIQNLTKSYPSARAAAGNIVALDRVSIHIPKGDFAAVMGTSGSGKSTLLNMIAGLDDQVDWFATLTATGKDKLR